MRISTLLSILHFLGLCAVEKKKLITIRFLLHAIIYTASICIFFGIEILDQNEWSRDEIIIFIFKVSTLTSVPVFFGLSSYGFISIKLLLEKHSYIKFPLTKFFFVLVIVLSFYIGLIPLERKIIFTPTTWKETCKSIAFMILIVQNGFGWFTTLFMQEINILIAKDVAESSLRQDNFDTEDVDNVRSTWEVVSSGQEIPYFVIITYAQILTILALYVFVSKPDIDSFPLVFASGSAFISLFVTCYQLENLYTKFRILSTKAYEQALESNTFPTIMR